jgi:trk system potassium uptake protein TrkH
MISGRTKLNRWLQRQLHPRSVGVIKLEGKRVDDSTVQGVGTYLALYFLLLAVVFLVVSLEPFGMESNLSAVVACLNNVGPGFGAVGPAGSFADYSAVSKIVLSLAMLLGRLEIYPILLVLTPSTWTKE